MIEPSPSTHSMSSSGSSARTDPRTPVLAVVPHTQPRTTSGHPTSHLPDQPPFMDPAMFSTGDQPDFTKRCKRLAEAAGHADRTGITGTAPLGREVDARKLPMNTDVIHFTRTPDKAVDGVRLQPYGDFHSGQRTGSRFRFGTGNVFEFYKGNEQVTDPAQKWLLLSRLEEALGVVAFKQKPLHRKVTHAIAHPRETQAIRHGMHDIRQAFLDADPKSGNLQALQLAVSHVLFPAENGVPMLVPGWPADAYERVCHQLIESGKLADPAYWKPAARYLDHILHIRAGLDIGNSQILRNMRNQLGMVLFMHSPGTLAKVLGRCGEDPAAIDELLPQLPPGITPEIARMHMGYTIDAMQGRGLLDLEQASVFKASLHKSRRWAVEIAPARGYACPACGTGDFDPMALRDHLKTQAFGAEDFATMHQAYRSVHLNGTLNDFKMHYGHILGIQGIDGTGAKDIDVNLKNFFLKILCKPNTWQ